MGRSARGMVDVIKMTAPAMMPALPIPAIALPTIKATEFGAAPHRADPTSKTKMRIKNTYFAVWKVYILPMSNWKQELVNMNADPYHPSCERLEFLSL